MTLFNDVVHWVSWIKGTVTFPRQKQWLGAPGNSAGFREERWAGGGGGTVGIERFPWEGDSEGTGLDVVRDWIGEVMGNRVGRAPH